MVCVGQGRNLKRIFLIYSLIFRLATVRVMKMLINTRTGVYCALRIPLLK